MATKRNSKPESPASIEGQNNLAPGSPRRRRSAAVANPTTNPPAASRSRRTKAPTQEVSVASSPLKTTEKAVGLSEQERIALLAYSFWEARGRQGGSPEEDWFRAEKEIRKGSSAVLAH
jgi:hypothetical protein